MAEEINYDKESIKALLNSEKKWNKYWRVQKKAIKEGMDTKGAHAKALASVISNNVEEEVIFKDDTQTLIGDISESERKLISEMTDGKSKNAREVIEWIYNNIGNPDVTPISSPTFGSYSHLKKIQNDPVLQAEFYKNIWPKILPKADIMDEYLTRLADDGGKVYNVIDRVLEAIDTVSVR